LFYEINYGVINAIFVEFDSALVHTCQDDTCPPAYFNKQAACPLPGLSFLRKPSLCSVPHDPTTLTGKVSLPCPLPGLLNFVRKPSHLIGTA
jgi:hypothetical protein